MEPPRELLDRLQIWQFLVHFGLCDWDERYPDRYVWVGHGNLIGLDTDTGGYAMCDEASKDFVAWCHLRGIPAYTVGLPWPCNLYLADEDCLDFPFRRGDIFHVVAAFDVEGGSWMFDFTARQFNAQLPFPYIWFDRMSPLPSG